ncbi:MAG: 6-phosphogluconolactonase, partial [Blastocatellia bacterium]|nr:6-phosphogluconolactonase [Blastocatellia bacterium]
QTIKAIATSLNKHKRDRFTLVLSGGSTPKQMFQLFGTDEMYQFNPPTFWERVHFFWGDERHVGPEHPDSNYKTAFDLMLSKIPIPAGNIHRIKAENPDAAAAAAEYERELREFFQLPEGAFPRFDLVFLGMGNDGHTASLFPGTRALGEDKRLVVSNWVGKLDTERITMTAPVLNNAEKVFFLVAGEDKAMPLKSVLEGPHEPQQLPAQLIKPERGRLLWLLDSQAARLLPYDQANFGPLDVSFFDPI